MRGGICQFYIKVKQLCNYTDWAQQLRDHDFALNCEKEEDLHDLSYSYINEVID